MEKRKGAKVGTDTEKVSDSNIGPIDLVYTWVDGNDPEWRARRNAMSGEPDENGAANCEGRYANHDELKYSLRSVEKYAPWINKIFIVTDRQIPAWLDTENPKIQIVDHSEILPEESRPCFNSTLFEHFLWKIPGLNEHFLYANDDTLLNAAVLPSDFFTTEGLPIIRHNRRLFREFYLWFCSKFKAGHISEYNKIVHNAASLVKSKFGKYYSGKAHHNIDSYLKSHCEHVEELFGNEVSQMLPHHFRESSDIQRSLFHYTALAEGMGKQKYVGKGESLRLRIHKPKYFEMAKKSNAKFMCVNDSEHAVETDRLRAQKFLADKFPDKSCFEK